MEKRFRLQNRTNISELYNEVEHAHRNLTYNFSFE